MKQPDYCSDNIATVSAIVFFFGFLFMLFSLIPASQALIPTVNTLRNDTVEWSFQGRDATLRAMNVPEHPILSQAYATQKDNAIELRDAAGNVETIERRALPPSEPIGSLYQWKHQGTDITMVDMRDVQRVKAQQAEKHFKTEAIQRAHTDITKLSPEMQTLLTMFYRYRVRGY